MRLVIVVAFITYCFLVWAEDDREAYRSPAQIVCCYDGDCHDCHNEFWDRKLHWYEPKHCECDKEKDDDETKGVSP